MRRECVPARASIRHNSVLASIVAARQHQVPRPARADGGTASQGQDRMVALFFLLFIGLELKHYIADYFLQPGWMLAGKGDFRQPGGYAHAAVHAGLTALVLLLAG